jgi:hypothetical protein
MASVIDVCNRALDKLGQNPITSLDDGNKAANLCTRSWPIVRDQVLREHPWNFAVKRKILSPSTTLPEWGFAYQHPLPSDCLRLIEIYNMSSDEYVVEGKYILADTDKVYIRYITRIEDPNIYDALFVDLVALRLAFEMVEGLTQSTTKKDWLWEEYKDALTRTKKADGQENPPVSFETDPWLSARY